MKSIELYINGKLCDTGNPEDFSVFMKRQLINPSELSSKDTQRSYDITLPTSATNNEILKHVHIEEVKSKFVNEYDACLIIGGVKIFEGKFKLTEVTAKEYRGNLGTPTRTIKDIFGETNMNATGTWKIPIKSLEDITKYNQEKNPDFFFPLVMYGLLPKIPKPTGIYSGKYHFDPTVALGVEDMPASLNCLTMLRKIFENKGISLSGSAFADERLSKLYVSYKNPNDYSMPWNYGDLGKMNIKGVWSNLELKADHEIGTIDSNVVLSSHPINEEASVFTANILHTPIPKHWENDTARIDTESDKPLSGWPYGGLKSEYKYSGNYISHRKEPDKSHYYSIRIPQSGYYKITLDASLFIPCSFNTDPKEYNYGLQPPFVKHKFKFFKDKGENVKIATAKEQNNRYNKYLDAARYELKLIRDRNSGSFDLDRGIDGTYFDKNYNQQFILKDGKPSTASTAIFPDIEQNNEQVLFVDPAQNPNLIAGFSWGRYYDSAKKSQYRQQHIADGREIDMIEKNMDHSAWNRTKNAKWATVLAAKSCHSWDYEVDRDPQKRSRVIINNPKGYMKYIHPNSQTTEEIDETPETEGTEEIIVTKSVTTNDLSQDFRIERINNFRMQLLDNRTDQKACRNFARRGYYRGVHGDRFKGLVSGNSDYWGLSINQCADGRLQAIVWLEQNERLTLVSSTDYGRNGENWIWHMLDFDLSIAPYRIDKSYANLSEYTGESLNNEPFFWKDTYSSENDFYRGEIDLIKFLPSNVKVDDWINNFCKAFNLDLIQNEEGGFELNVKRDPNQSNSIVIDLDCKAHVTVERKNIPLGLPGTFSLGFTCNKDEIGYYKSTLRYDSNKLEKILSLPVISDKEVWGDDNGDYSEMMLKSYTDKAQRFWYKDSKTHKTKLNGKSEVEVGLVRNALNGANPMILDYKNQPNSIMRNYFTMLADTDNCFTTVECYLSPEEYAIIDRALVRFNGDMYHVAEVDGFDPQGKKKATVKLIRKIL